jgi:hypothetical protein
MKRIELYIGSTHFVIDECEGEAQIRHADRPRADAARHAFVTVRRDGIDHTIDVKVEKTE